MNKDISFLLLAAVLFIPQGVLLFAAAAIQQKEEKTHDERSMMLRGKVYRDTFYVMMTLCVMTAVINGIRNLYGMVRIATTAATLFLIIGITLSFLVSDLCLRGAYFGRQFDEKKYRGQGFVMLFIAAIEMLALFTWGDYSGFSIPFEMGSEAMMIVGLIWCLSIAISCFIRYGHHKKECLEADNE